MQNWFLATVPWLGFVGVGVLVFIKIYAHFSKGYYEIKEDLTGKTILITGANTGIGKETAFALAAKGAKVILACRNLSKAQKAQEEIVAQTGNRNVIVKQLDLCSFKSVRDFANDILQTEPHLDILINNAGMNTPSELKVTIDGYEETFQANYLGHFLLTLLLLEFLKRSAPSRIINVASIASWIGIGNTKNFNVSLPWWNLITYATTKTFNILFTVKLANHLKGTGVTANCCHPGAVKSEFLRSQSEKHFSLLGFIINNFGRSSREGAMTSLYLATSPEVKNITGTFFYDCKPSSLLVPPWASNKRRAEKLSKTSLKAVGLENI